MKQYKWLLYKILLTKSRVPKVWETINELQTLFMMGLSMLFFNNGMFKPDINEPATPTPTIEPVSYAGYGRWLNPRCGSYGSTLLYAPDTTVTRAAIAATVAFLGANASLACGATMGFATSEELLRRYANESAIYSRTRAAIFFDENAATATPSSTAAVGYSIAMPQPITGQCLHPLCSLHGVCLPEGCMCQSSWCGRGCEYSVNDLDGGIGNEQCAATLRPPFSFGDFGDVATEGGVAVQVDMMSYGYLVTPSNVSHVPSLADEFPASISDQQLAFRGTGLAWATDNDQEYRETTWTKRLSTMGGMGFVELQAAVDRALAIAIDPSSQASMPSWSGAIGAAPFPRHAFKSSWAPDVITMKLLLPIYSTVPIGLMGQMMVTIILFDREKKLDEGLRMMGMRNTPYFASWLTVYVTMVTVSSLLTTFVLGFALLNAGSAFMVFITMELYGTAVVAFGFFITTVFKDHQTGQGIMFFAFLVFIGAYCGIANTAANGVGAWLGSLVPYIAGPLAIHRFVELESEVHNGRGMGWGDLMHGTPFSHSSTLQCPSLSL